MLCEAEHSLWLRPMALYGKIETYFIFCLRQDFMQPGAGLTVLRKDKITLNSRSFCLYLSNAGTSRV